MILSILNDLCAELETRAIRDLHTYQSGGAADPLGEFAIQRANYSRHARRAHCLREMIYHVAFLDFVGALRVRSDGPVADLAARRPRGVA